MQLCRGFQTAQIFREGHHQHFFSNALKHLDVPNAGGSLCGTSPVSYTHLEVIIAALEDAHCLQLVLLALGRLHVLAEEELEKFCVLEHWRRGRGGGTEEKQR